MPMLPPRLCISCLHLPFCQKYAKVEPYFWCEGHEPVSETGFKNRLGRLRTTVEALLAKAQQVAGPRTLPLRKNARSLIARACCVACTARAGCPTSKGLEDTCEKFEPVSERGLGIRIGQLSMAPEDATAWKTFTRTAALPDGNARKEAWRAKLPQCAPKDSTEYIAWEQRNREVTPCLADPTSKAHQDWLSSLPSARPEGSPEKQAWREKNASTQPRGSARYEEWKARTLGAQPALQVTSSPVFSSWKKRLLAKAPSAQRRGSAEYRRWLEFLPQANPDGSAYSNWYRALLDNPPETKYVTGYTESAKGCDRQGASRLWYASSYERAFLVACDADPTVLSFQWQPFEIPYLFEGKRRNYTPDAFVRRESGLVLVEIKPQALTNVPDEVLSVMPEASRRLIEGIRAKQKAAEDWCEENGAQYEFWSPEVSSRGAEPYLV